MKKSKFSERKILSIIKEYESGLSVREIARKYGIAKSTFYNWKRKYGGMEASDLERLKELEAENKRLKQMYSNLSLEHKALKDVVEKKL